MVGAPRDTAETGVSQVDGAELRAAEVNALEPGATEIATNEVSHAAHASAGSGRLASGSRFVTARTAQPAAALIDQHLTARFGSDLVFLDSRSIPVGTEFAEQTAELVMNATMLRN